MRGRRIAIGCKASTHAGRVTVADPNGGRVEYGIDGATCAIIVEAEASGIVRNLAFTLKGSIGKHGISA